MTVSDRILAQLRHGAATAAQLTGLVYSTDQHVRHCLAALKRAGKVRQAGQAIRVHNNGAIPRYWEAA